MVNVIQFIRGISDGGAESLVKEYVRLIDKEKFSITIVGLFVREKSANYKILKSEKIEIIPIYKKWNILTKVFNKILGRVYIPIFLAILIKKKNISVIHAHMTVLKYLKPIWKKLKNIKLFYTCHSIPEKYFGKHNRDEYKAAKWLIKHNNLKLIALHEGMMLELNRLFDINNTVVLHNGIDFNRFENVYESKEEVRRSLNIPLDSFVLGHVGRFHKVKNHEFLVELFRKIKQIKKEAFLFMIGDGKEKETIERLIDRYGLEKSVLILSNRSDVPRLLKAMDVFVFPSLYEGLGIVMIEAQKSGLRCVASTAVPKNAYVTDLAVALDLDAPISTWINAILDDSIRGIPYGNFSDYDMNSEIKKLEKMYIS